MLALAFAATLATGIGLAAMMLFTRSRVARWPIAAGTSLLVAWLAATAAARLFGDPSGDLKLLVLVGAPLLALQLVFRPIQWPSRLFLASLALTSGVYIAVLVRLTFFGSLPWLGVGLSGVLLTLEVMAILLSLGFAYEMADALGRPLPVNQLLRGAEAYRPRVCIQVPAYNEPPELLRTTLEALANLDYPDYVVQVVVNNTTDPALWAPVEHACRELGPRFHFLNLPQCPGYKAGALNEATRRLPRGVEVVAIVDADYLVHRDFLAACVPYLADPQVAFVQTPQHYREWKDSAYLRGLFHAYRYFFDVTMVTRSRVNAIIFGGTMGLIRLAALREIGGWAEWCITEDAEASLRLLARGWRSVYLNQAMGEGLMPLDFDGLRRQRFRWAFGGVQILRRHVRLMVGLGPSKLTAAQRYHYLMGAFGWFGDPVSVGLGFFLLFTAPLMALGHPLLLRQLIGVLLVMPLFLLISGLVRLGWALKVATGARWPDVPAAVLVMLALSWTVTRACLRALLRDRGIFLRTPKVRTPSRLGKALLSTSTESAVGVAFVIAVPLVLLHGPQPISVVIAVLLLWQAAAWSTAPAASLLAQGIRLTPSRLLFGRSPQNTGNRVRQWPARGRRLALAPVLAIVALLLGPGLISGGGNETGLRQALGLPPSGPVPALAAASPPTGQQPNRTKAASTPGASGTQPGLITTPSAAPSSAVTTPSRTPTSSPTPRPLPTPTGTPSPHPTPTSPTPSARPSPTPR